jgi:hypothetical protein
MGYSSTMRDFEVSCLSIFMVLLLMRDSLGSHSARGSPLCPFSVEQISRGLQTQRRHNLESRPGAQARPAQTLSFNVRW